MKAYLTICSKKKKLLPYKLPAIHRYKSKRIEWLYRKSLQENMTMFIFSGKYGLLRPEDEIAWYNHKLKMQEVPEIVPRIVEQLKTHPISDIYFYAEPKTNPNWEPYHIAIEQVCQITNIKLEWIQWKESMLEETE